MKQYLIFQLIFLCLISCNLKPGNNSEGTDNNSLQFVDSAEMTNNFYDNTETYQLPVKDLIIEGEISNPGKVDFSILSKHSVIVKETLLDNKGSDRFTGAFRYDGYSLFDILDKRIIKKENNAEFNPIIDLFVEIENDKGEKIVLSWGEIYYPNNLHRIIIASSVSRIVPSRTKVLWTLPEASKLVVGSDLFTERNISNPVKITIRSFPVTFPVVPGMSPIYSSEIRLFSGKKMTGELVLIPETVNNVTFNTIFYGRGRGIHSTSPFTGYLLKDILAKHYPVTKENLRSGILCIIGQDGYRCAISFSELFNRNEQQEFLVIKIATGEDGGLFRLFAAGDFFSDRAVKSISEIHLGF